MDSWRPNPDVVAERMGDSVVLIHLQTNRIFELNRTGARFWALLAEGHGVEAIVARMLEEFEVDEGSLRPEVDRILGALAEERLVVRA